MDKEKDSKTPKKETRQLLFDKMSASLEEFKVNVKEKKFAASLRKAARQLANDLEKGIKKGKNKTKKAKVKVKNKVEKAV